jgi:hypothetical protein
MKTDNPSAKPEMNLDKLALSYLDKEGTTNVRDLYEVLRVNQPSLSESEMATLVWRLSEQSRVRVEDVPFSGSFTQYVSLWERNLSLYASLTVALLAILSIYAIPADSSLGFSRWILGSIFVLFIPGYVTVQVLFPGSSDLNSIERFALSIGLSLAIIMFVGLLLNYTPWGIRLDPIVITLTILTIGLVLAGLVRKYASQETLPIRRIA